MLSSGTSLSFTGNCEEAFNFYKAAFGVEFTQLMKWKDVPGYKEEDGQGEWVTHVSMPIGKESFIMGGDVPKGMGPINVGNNMSICVITESEEQTTKLYDAIGAGGKVKMALGKTFWNAYYGIVVDKFGIEWMFNYTYPTAK